MASAPSSSTTRVWLKSTPPPRVRPTRLNRGVSSFTPFGYIEQRPAGPERRVQGREEVVAGGDRLRQQVAIEDLGVVLGRLRQIDEDRAAQLGRVGLAGRDAVDVQHARGIMGAHGAPQVVEGGDGPDRRLSRSGRGEGVELERANIRPPPLLFAGAGPGERLEPRERLAAALGQPRGLIAPLHEPVEGVLGEAAGGRYLVCHSGH